MMVKLRQLRGLPPKETEEEIWNDKGYETVTYSEWTEGNASFNAYVNIWWW